MQLNAAPFLAGIARVQTSMRNLQAAAAGITGAFFAVRSTMAGLSAVFDGMKNALDMGGKFADLSASTGASVSELVMLSQAFQNAGLGADAVGPMIARFQKSLAGVNEDGQSTSNVLQKLGINTLALSRMSVSAQFQELSRAISAIEDPAERTKRAMELFGRSGAQMLALFRDPEAFTRAAAEVGIMGDVLEANAGKFDSMSDALVTLGTKVDQFFVGAMSTLQQSSALEDAAKTDFTPTGQSAGAAAAAIMDLSKAASDYIALLPGIKMMKDMFLNTFIDPKIVDAAASSIDQQTQLSTSRFDPAVRSVSNEGERVAVLEELTAAIDAARARMDNLDSEFANVPEDARVKIVDALGRQIGMLDRQRDILSQITPETMAANAAEAERAAALAKSAAEAAKLAEQVDKAMASRDAETEKRILSGLSPADASNRVLGQIGAGSFEAVGQEIESLRSLGADATDEQKARIMELVEAEKTLLEIKGRQTQEDEKRAEQAERINQLMGDLAIDAEKVVAEASGDTARVAELDRAKAAAETQRRFEAEGMDPGAAAELAGKQAELQQIGKELGDAVQKMATADSQRAIGLGGNVFAETRTPLNEIASRAKTTNDLLQKLIAETAKRGPTVLLAETFD